MSYDDAGEINANNETTRLYFHLIIMETISIIYDLYVIPY